MVCPDKVEERNAKTKWKREIERVEVNRAVGEERKREKKEEKNRPGYFLATPLGAFLGGLARRYSYPCAE